MQKQHLALTVKALKAIVFAWFCLFLTPAVWAQISGNTALQPVPALTARIIDQSNTLSSAELQSLSAQLQQLEEETGAQVAVLMVPSTAPEDIASYAFRVASSWKLGRKDVGDGALIVVAKDDRRMRIEVARKLEGALSDIMVARILDESIQPRFQLNDYAGGLSAAIAGMALRIKGEALTPPEDSKADTLSSPAITGIALLWLLGAPVARWMLGRVKASILVGAVTGIAVFVMERSLPIAGGAALVGMIIALLGLSNILRGGRGGKAGGFRSGGGGRFGGGGASGGW